VPTTTTRLGLDVALGSDNVSAWPSYDSQSKGILDGAAMYLSGTLVLRPSSASTPAGTIYRATDDLTFGPNGTPYFNDGTSWTALAAVPGVWTALSLASGVSVVSLAPTPAARLIPGGGGVVQLKGSMSNTSGGTLPSWATVPASLFPTGACEIPCGYQRSGTFSAQLLQINPNRTMTLSSGITTANGDLLYLNGAYALS
jgi:hypothetical protein